MNRAKALEELIASMVDLYSFVDAGGELKSTLLRLEDVVTRIVIQTTECGIFILHYTCNTGRLIGLSSARDDLFSVWLLIAEDRPVPQTISQTQSIVSSLARALTQLRAELESREGLQTPFVSVQSTWAVESSGLRSFLSLHASEATET